MTTATSTFEVVVDSHLDDRWMAWLEAAEIDRREDGTTVLTGPFADQAQLHGLLSRIRDLNLPLLTLRTSQDNGIAAQAPRQTSTSALGEIVHTARLVLRPASETDADAT